MDEALVKITVHRPTGRRRIAAWRTPSGFLWDAGFVQADDGRALGDLRCQPDTEREAIVQRGTLPWHASTACSRLCPDAGTECGGVRACVRAAAAGCCGCPGACRISERDSSNPESRALSLSEKAGLRAACCVLLFAPSRQLSRLYRDFSRARPSAPHGCQQQHQQQAARDDATPRLGLLQLHGATRCRVCEA